MRACVRACVRARARACVCVCACACVCACVHRGVANLASYTCESGEDPYTTTMAIHSEAPRDTASLKGSEQDLVEPANSPLLGSAGSPGIVLVDTTDGDVDSPASVL